MAADRPPASAADLAAFLRAGRQSEDHRVVVCVGDSITRGEVSANWVDLLQTRLGPEGHRFVNAGANGDLAWNVLQRLDDIVRCAPDAVTLLVGTNDVSATFSPEQSASFRARQGLPRTPDFDWYTECVDAVLARLHAETDADLVVLDIPMVGEDLSTPLNHRVTAYNDALRRIAATHAAPVLPLHDRLAALLPSPHNPPPYTGSIDIVIEAATRHLTVGEPWDRISAGNGLAVLVDHVHLNDRAAAVVADVVAEFLVSARLETA